MLFNPDITKQGVEIIFSVKNNKLLQPNFIFNGVPVAREESTKPLGVHFDTRLNFSKLSEKLFLKLRTDISLNL